MDELYSEVIRLGGVLREANIDRKALDEEVIGLLTTLSGFTAIQAFMAALTELVSPLKSNVRLDGTQMEHVESALKHIADVQEGDPVIIGQISRQKMSEYLLLRKDGLI